MANRRVSEPSRVSVRDDLVVLVADAVAEVEAWWPTVVELGERTFAHPAANEMRFAAAMRVLSQLEQLESELGVLLRQLGHHHEQVSDDGEDANGVPPPCRQRRVPERLRGVPDGHWTDPVELEQLTYAQLYDMTLADDPSDLDNTAARWTEIGEAAAAREVQLADLLAQLPAATAVDEVQLAGLVDRYRNLAPTVNRCARAMERSAASLRQAQQQMRELGPP